ncbi:phosphotransferase family protein [Kitasatospora sp. NPDC048365]|uniref:phosphotransferase family protein n=1 Tax=Kitasatospora sp. NPDC048365 TaxID=3364050 RepID=UPI00371F760B
MSAPARPAADRQQETAAVARLLRDALGPVEVVAVTALTGGLYNTARRVELADGRRLVLKCAPAASLPALTHETGLLGTERRFHRLAAATGVRVPEVIHHQPADPPGSADRPEAPGEWLLLEYLDGTTWDHEKEHLGADQRAGLRRRLGETAARIATVTGPEFGYPQATDPALRGADWPTAFARMFAAVLADADRFDVPLPADPAVLGALPARFARELAEVRRPALVHFDAWEGNVILTPSADGWEFAGLIDGERAFFGDPLAELVGLDALGTPEDEDPDLLAGYRSVMPGLVLDRAARVRLALYRIYLALIMRVEAAPRGYAPDHTAWLVEWSAQRIAEQLVVLDAD